MAVKDFAVYRKIKNRILDNVENSIKADKEVRGKEVEALNEQYRKIASSCREKSKAASLANSAFMEFAEELFMKKYGFVKSFNRVEVATSENPYTDTTYIYDKEIYDLSFEGEAVVSNFNGVRNVSPKTLYEAFKNHDILGHLERETENLKNQVEKLNEELETAEKNLSDYRKRFFKTNRTERKLVAEVETLTAKKEALLNESKEISQLKNSYKSDLETISKLYKEVERTKKEYKAVYDESEKVWHQVTNACAVSEAGLWIYDDRYYISAGVMDKLVNDSITAEDIKTLKNDNFFVQSMLNEKKDNYTLGESYVEPSSKEFNRYLDVLITNKITEEMYNDVNSETEEC